MGGAIKVIGDPARARWANEFGRRCSLQDLSGPSMPACACACVRVRLHTGEQAQSLTSEPFHSPRASGFRFGAPESDPCLQVQAVQLSSCVTLDKSLNVQAGVASPVGRITLRLALHLACREPFPSGRVMAMAVSCPSPWVPPSPPP